MHIAILSERFAIRPRLSGRRVNRHLCLPCATLPLNVDSQ
jgi:hypothetical protein